MLYLLFVEVVEYIDRRNYLISIKKKLFYKKIMLICNCQKQKVAL